jgi:hypothetical protein
MSSEDKEKLIYDLIFSEETEYIIGVHEYVKNLWMYDRFIDEIKSVLSKSRVAIIRETVTVDSNSIIWKIKVKK